MNAWRVAITLAAGLVMGACERPSHWQNDTSIAEPPQKQDSPALSDPTQAPAEKVAIETKPPTASPEARPAPLSSRPTLNLEVPASTLDAPEVNDASQVANSKAPLPDLFNDTKEKNLEFDGGIKLQEQESLQRPKLESVEIQLKSRF